MRRPATLLLLVIACAESGLLPVEERLTVESARVDFGRTFVAHPRSRTLTIRNDFRGPRRFHFAVAPPFAVEAESLEVAGLGSASLVVRFAPTVAGDAAGTLRLSSGEESLSVDLRGRGEPVPECVTTATCKVSRFEPDREQCVERPADDRTPCANGCLDAGHCKAGVCVGTARSCDDLNRCTADACDPDTGCVNRHDPAAVCPASSDPCRVPTCDPARGCSLVNASDGTSCGTYDCAGAHLCAQGRCVTLAVPEGAPCRSASLCPGAGVCRAKQCVDLGPNELSPTWEYASPAGRVVHGDFAMDGEGNTYVVEVDLSGVGEAKRWLVGLDRSGRVRFEVDVGTSHCWDLERPVVSGNAVLVESSDGVLTARSWLDGSEMWRTDIGAAIEDRGLANAAGRVGIRYVTGLHGSHVMVHTLGSCASRDSPIGAWIAVVATRDGAVVDVRRQPEPLGSIPVTNSAGDVFVAELEDNGVGTCLRSYDLHGVVRWNVTETSQTAAPSNCRWVTSSDDAVFCWEYGAESAAGWLIRPESGLPLHRLPIASPDFTPYFGNTSGGHVPALTQGRLFVAGVACLSQGVDPYSGEERWNCPREHGSIIRAFETLTGTPLWHRDLAEPHENATLSSPVALRDSVLWLKLPSYGGSDRNELLELSFDGELRSRCRLPPNGRPHLLLANGLLVNAVGTWPMVSRLRGYLLDREAATSGSPQYRGGPGQTGQAMPEPAP